MNPARPFLHHKTRYAILRLWRELGDTMEIAKRLKLPEATVYNFLARR